MDFFLFLALTLTLFVRPAEIVPALIGLPIYNVIILLCLAASLPRVARQFRGDALGRAPVTICVLGLEAAVVLSHLARFNFYDARESGVEFLKVVVCYVVFVAAVDSPRRLRRYLFWFFGFILLLSALALLQYHGYVSIPALEVLEEREYDPLTGEYRVIPRLRSTGIYNDPNDLCSIVVVGVVLGLFFLGDRRLGVLRAPILPALGMLGYTIMLTQSRGGFLALMVGLMTLFRERFGWRRTLLVGAVALPPMLALFGGRQTDLSSIAEGTGQDRVELWREGLQFLKQSPLFGIGQNQYSEEAGLVAHNSFVHCYGELGFFGGGLFLGAFYATWWVLKQDEPGRGSSTPDDESRRLRPFLVATVLAYATSLFSISRPYVVPTYLILGLGTAYHATTGGGALPLRRLAARAVPLALAFPAFVYALVKVMPH